MAHPFSPAGNENSPSACTERLFGKKELRPLFNDLMSKKFNFGDFVGHAATGDIDGYLVADFVAQKGLEVGVVEPVYFTAVILLIVVSSVATPLALKALFTKMPPVPHPSEAKK